MTMRIIDTVSHSLTGRQALAALLDVWREDRTIPIAIFTTPRGAKHMVGAIRVALSKERSRIGKTGRHHYGFLQSEPFPFTHRGVRGEAILLRFRLTMTQQLRNVFDLQALPLASQTKERINAKQN